MTGLCKKHKTLLDQCTKCEDEAEIESFRAKVAELEKERDKYRKALVDAKVEAADTMSNGKALHYMLKTINEALK